MVEVLYILLSLVLLYFGAEWLVKGGASMATRLGVTPLVVGLTVVAMGTSMPELVVSVKAALNGQSNMAVGNVLGSNIFNVGMILGLSALITPLKVKLQLLRWDLPILVVVSILFFVLFGDKRIGVVEGLLFLVLLIGYVVWNIRKSKKGDPAAQGAEDFEEPIKVLSSWKVDLVAIVAGIGLLVFGSDLLVNNAVVIAKSLGMSDAIIGLTVVAAGTSLPELATSVVAAIRKRTDIAIGNVIGSNLFNILAILGVSSVIKPIEAELINFLDMGVMMFLTLLLIPLMKTGFVISRREGFLLLLVYVAYVAFLIVQI